MQGVPESGTLGVFASTDQLGDQNFSKRLNAYLHVRTGHRKCGNSDAWFGILDASDANLWIF